MPVNLKTHIFLIKQIALNFSINMYAMKAMFVFLLLCAQVDVVESRRLPLDIALDDMRNRLQDAATSTELLTTDFMTEISTGYEYYTEAPMITIITSTAVMDPPVSTIVTPATFPAEITSDFNSHSSLVRAVLNRIAQECQWGDDRCAALETEVAQLLNRARLQTGPVEPLMSDAASVVYMVVCIVFVIVGLTGLVLSLDRFLPSEAVYGGLSYVGHAVMDLCSGVWRFLFRRHVARSQVVEPMTARPDGEPRSRAVVEPVAAFTGAAVYLAMYPAVFQVLYFVCILGGGAKSCIVYTTVFVLQLGRGFVHGFKGVRIVLISLRF